MSIKITTFPEGISVPIITEQIATGFQNQFVGDLYSSRGRFGNGSNFMIIGAEAIKSNNFISGSQGFQIEYNGDVEFNTGIFRGDLIAGSIHIPDQNTSVNSFHTDSDGNSWWGCAEDSFTANNSNALAYVLKTGVAKFQSVTISGGANVVFISDTLDTSSKTVLKDFTFSPSDYSGAFKTGDIAWNTATGVITGGTGFVINKLGIIGASAGATTVAILTDGTASFAGALSAATGTFSGSLTVGTDLDNAVTANWPSDTNLALYWSFDEGAGLVAIDGSNNGNNGTLNNFSLVEKITNGTFASDIAGWTDNSTPPDKIEWSASYGGSMKMTGSTAYSWADQTITTKIGSKYNVSVELKSIGGGGGNLFIGTTQGASDLANLSIPSVGVFTTTFVATGTTTYIRITTGWNDFYVDNISVMPVSWWKAGISGTMLDLDGADDYVSKASPSFVNNTEGAVSMWVKIDNLDTEQIIWSLSKDGSTDDELYMDFRGDSNNIIIITLLVNGVVTLTLSTANNAIADSNLHHIVLTSDGSTIKLYIDNVEKTLTESTGTNSGQWFASATDANIFSVGALKEAAVGFFLNGDVDEVRVYSAGLIASEVYALYKNPGGQKKDSVPAGKLTAGTIYSKQITLAVADGTGDSFIAAGKTDFTNAESGFILGIDDSDSDLAKFYIGNSTKFINWDGTTLIAQDIKLTSSTAGTLGLYATNTSTNTTIILNPNGAGGAFDALLTLTCQDSVDGGLHITQNDVDDSTILAFIERNIGPTTPGAGAYVMEICNSVQDGMECLALNRSGGVKDGAHLRFVNGVNNDNVREGAFWYDGTNLQFADSTPTIFDMAMSDGTTGGAGSAGAGNQYVELNIGGITYKVLHDGTV